MSASEGSAKFTTWLAGGSADWRLSTEASPWAVSLGAGAAAAWVGTKGDAKAPLLSSSGAGVTAAPFLEARGARDLGTPNVHLGIEGMLGATFPGVGIQFAGAEVASWGRPFAGLAVVLELDTR